MQLPSCAVRSLYGYHGRCHFIQMCILQIDSHCKMVCGIAEYQVFVGTDYLLHLVGALGKAGRVNQSQGIKLIQVSQPLLKLFGVTGENNLSILHMG